MFFVRWWRFTPQQADVGCKTLLVLTKYIFDDAIYRLASFLNSLLKLLFGESTKLAAFMGEILADASLSKRWRS